MDLILKTANYIVFSFGSADYDEQVNILSHYLAFVLNEKEETVNRLLTLAVKIK